MSQTTLADELGLSFQQVQKYEKGRNRIGASRMQHIAHILQVPVAFFFEGLPSAGPLSKQVTDFMATREGLALAEAFMRIRNVRLRRRIVHLVEQIEEDRSRREQPLA